MNAHGLKRRLHAECLEDRLPLAGDAYGYMYSQPSSSSYYGPGMYGSAQYGSPDNREPGPSQSPTYSYPSNPQPGYYYLS